MTHKHCFESLDRTFRDIMSIEDENANNIVFGGKTVVLGGDLRQILPVIEGGSQAEIIAACITKSYLWNHVHILKLTTNMRLTSSALDAATQAELALFSKWILDLGEGKLPAVCLGNESDPTWIDIPSDLLLYTEGDKIAAIVNSIYSDIAVNFSHSSYLCQRAILTPTNNTADDINNYILDLIPGEQREYLSCDSISKSSDATGDGDLLYPTEFLNSLQFNGFPQHRLILKKGVPIMLLRNISQSEGLCNGTRLIITNLAPAVIEAMVITGTNIGDIVYIPRIMLIAKKTKLPFTLQRRQFPIRICYAMTINKSQGQTLDNVGIYLKEPIFTHGQLYVAVSRVTSKKGLTILIENEDGSCGSKTRNIVYKDVLSCIP